jgi:hypothetical protein
MLRLPVGMTSGALSAFAPKSRLMSMPSPLLMRTSLS